MATISEIENAIIKLPKDEIKKFREWFIHYDNKKWDTEIKNDLKSGLLNELTQEAIDDYESGNCKEL